MRDKSAAPYLALPRSMLPFPMAFLEKLALYAKIGRILSTDDKQFMFVFLLNLKPQLLVQDSTLAASV